MTLIYEGTFERTLDRIVARFADAEGAKVQAWTFDDEASRRAAEAALATRGVRARFRSAYKPLLHFFLEEVDLRELAQIRVAYPVHDACPANRFLLETYPLAALVGDAPLSFEPATGYGFHYHVALTGKDGRISEHAVFAPNRLHMDNDGEALVSPTGWIRTGDGNDGERLETDYESLFHKAIEAVASWPWGDGEPYFDELNIAVTLPIEDRRLSADEEVVSLREAIHEDLYFSLLEFFQKKSGRPNGDRGLRPGQIVPEIRFARSAPTVRIETRALTATETAAPFVTLDQAVSPIPAAQVRAELAKIGGVSVGVQSRSGRLVEARYRKGSDHAVMISAGQHANETTGIVGALRAARELAARENSHFAVSPLENPDGYQMHWRLRADNPHHMHHAARYTALGDDLEYRAKEPLFEKAIRKEAERLSGAKLHLNLHGYPSHEWTRPLSGYVPRDFDMWTIPKGFFLVMRHHVDWAGVAERLVDRVTARLAELPGLVDYTMRQIRLFEYHCGETNFRMVNGVSCLIAPDDRHVVPLTLITEYPDETIYGHAFVEGHTAQAEFVLAAYEAYQLLFAGGVHLEAVPTA
ncbi:M14 family zinc carboxypeptidase [Chelativorans sp. AA-79]|uniref:M14 family zinc carboxypeptidase n=1 Tax=Chelativorans sp. AA-79 TaxID=3028735 RepID=UPI0023F98C88|nr:M14 family zinc carboxypeptidase [Chelativorans sp. AA-79]WEX11966.1 M14 family zinc carboxypeptidase [Chelativorans sp. AA-79]